MKDLRRLRRAVERAEQARKEIDDALIAAHRAGESTRDMAAWAKVSKSQVHYLLQKARRNRDGHVLALVGTMAVACAVLQAICGPGGCPVHGL